MENKTDTNLYELVIGQAAIFGIAALAVLVPDLHDFIVAMVAGSVAVTGFATLGINYQHAQATTRKLLPLAEMVADATPTPIDNEIVELAGEFVTTTEDVAKAA